MSVLSSPDPTVLMGSVKKSWLRSLSVYPTLYFLEYLNEGWTNQLIIKPSLNRRLSLPGEWFHWNPPPPTGSICPGGRADWGVQKMHAAREYVYKTGHKILLIKYFPRNKTWCWFLECSPVCLAVCVIFGTLWSYVKVLVFVRFFKKNVQ